MAHPCCLRLMGAAGSTIGYDVVAGNAGRKGAPSMLSNDHFLSAAALILAILSLVLCFVLGYAGPAVGAAAAAAALYLAYRVHKKAPNKTNKAARGIALAGLIVNAVSGLAMLMMMLLGAAYMGSAFSMF